MKKIASIIITVFIIVSNGYLSEASVINVNSKNEKLKIVETIMKQDLLCMMMAYPEYITDIKLEDSGMTYLILKSGRKLIYDDKKNKNFEQKLDNPDIQDMLEQIYPLISNGLLMDKNFDPGRFRVNSLLKEVYGGTEAQVGAKLTMVNTGYKSFQFNKSNKAAEALKSVMKELVPLSNKRREVRACVTPASGTFNYRVISGTNRLSPHAFGIAIDLASNKKDYWKWASKKQGEERLAVYPKEIVEIFERNNFVWGGKWNHFDILHFEYRPEIILKAKYFGDKSRARMPWYEGVNTMDINVSNYINIIEKAFSS